MCLLLLFASGCGKDDKEVFSDEAANELTPVSSIIMGEEDAQRITDKVPIRLYFANKDNTKLQLMISYAPLSEVKKSVSAQATYIVNQLITGPGENSGLNPTIPEGTKLCSNVQVEDGVATVDLSKEFISNQTGGKDKEKLTIYSIVNSLTELKDIHKVKFTIEGKEVEEYRGNFKFNVPFPRTENLISKEVEETKAQTDTGKTASSSLSAGSTTSSDNITDIGTSISTETGTGASSSSSTSIDLDAEYEETFIVTEDGEILTEDMLE